MLAVYLYVSSLIFLMGGIMWAKSPLVNLLVKIGLYAMAVVGVKLILSSL